MIDSAEKTIVMLVVEDNPADVAFFKEAVESAEVPAAIHVAGDGDRALQFLRRQGAYTDAPRPDVIVLDLNLPIRSGSDALAEMAPNAELNTIPVAILTTSTSERCVCDLYPRGRCLYFTKTDDFRQLKDIVMKIVAHARVA